MMRDMVHYEVYATYRNSDVLTFDTLEEAIDCAVEWSMESVDCEFSIVKVEKTIVRHFRNGGEIG